MLKYGNFCDKLFAEVVNTEINCMQVKKKCLQEEGDTKKFLAAGDAYKRNFACEYFSKTEHSSNGRTCSGKLNSVI